MRETISEAAEQVARGVSRREFLGRLGRGATVLAAAVGGMLALPDVARAKKPPKSPPPPAWCDIATSSHECFGLTTADICYVGPYRGFCTSLGGGGAACYCDIGPGDHR